MARIFLDKEDNPLLGAVTGFQQGRKLRDDELYRKAVQQMAKNKQLADLEMEAQKTGAMPTYNEQGDWSGYVDSPLKPRIDKALERSAKDLFANSAADAKGPPAFPGIPGKPKTVGDQWGTPALSPEEQAAIDADLQKRNAQTKAKAAALGLPTGPQSPQPQDDAASRAKDLLNAPLQYQEKPLLANPQEAKLKEGISKSGQPFAYDPNAAKYLKTEIKNGVPTDINVAPAAKTTANVTDAAVVDAPISPPSIAEQSNIPAEDYSLPWPMIGRAIDYATTARSKDANRQYFVGQLPEPMQRDILGKGPEDPITPQEQSLPIPEAAYVELLKRGTKTQQGAVRPEVAAAVDEVINGRLSMSDFYQNFQNITPAEAKLFDRGFGYSQKNAGMRVDPQVQQWADKALGELSAGRISRDLPIGVPMTPGNRATIDLVLSKQRQKIAEDSSIRAAQKFELDQNKLSPKQEAEFNALSEMDYYISQAKSQVDNGLVDPRNILAVSQSMGITGGPFVGPMNWIYEAFGNKAITPEEFNFLRSISQNNLSNLVSKAGTTFTEGFMKRINNLGADVSDPARFRASVDFIMKEIRQKQQMIVRNAKLNKAGKLGSELGDKPSQSQAPADYKGAGQAKPQALPQEAKGNSEAVDRRKALAKIAELKAKYVGPDKSAELQSKINDVKNRFDKLYPGAKLYKDGGVDGKK